MPLKILIINGSIRGEHGNSFAIALKAKAYIESTNQAQVEIYTLTQPKASIRQVFDLLVESDAFIVISGSYWDNMSSNLLRFIEVCTPYENSAAFWGKPISTIISMDSVGGVGAANKIITAFTGLGCWTTPCSTVILSRLAEEAVKGSKKKGNNSNIDVWRLTDIEILIDNLVLACGLNRKLWKAWPTIKLHLKERDWPETGEIDMGNPKFI